MKARVKNYIEMPLADVPECIPDLVKVLRETMPDFDTMLNDSEYIIRISNDGRVEVGYASDDWSVA